MLCHSGIGVGILARQPSARLLGFKSTTGLIVKGKHPRVFADRLEGPLGKLWDTPVSAHGFIRGTSRILMTRRVAACFTGRLPLVRKQTVYQE